MMASVIAAWAQGLPTEPITVTGTKSREVIQQFVTAFATPTRMTGKIARWEDGVCPVTVGQPPAIANIVTQRVKDLARFVGAPVNQSQSCTPNIEIVFTRSPQELLNNVRTKNADYLGFSESAKQRDKLAIVTRPIQAWYTTQTRDLHGLNRIDSGNLRGEGMEMSNFTAGKWCGTLKKDCAGEIYDPFYLPYASQANISGNRISDGVRSAFYHILMVADPGKLQGHGIGELADYIAVLALTQIGSLDTCQPLPSIENLMAANCESKTDMLTKNDVAYLRGVYSMSADRRLFATQKSEIVDRMKDALDAQ